VSALQQVMWLCVALYAAEGHWGCWGQTGKAKRQTGGRGVQCLVDKTAMAGWCNAWRACMWMHVQRFRHTLDDTCSPSVSST
jgi:hypothetical protein